MVKMSKKHEFTFCQNKKKMLLAQFFRTNTHGMRLAKTRDARGGAHYFLFS